MKKTLMILALLGSAHAAHGVILENKVDKFVYVLVWHPSADPDLKFVSTHALPYKGSDIPIRLNIGSEPITFFAVAHATLIDHKKPIDREIQEKGFELIIPKKYKEALTMLPDAVITIIPDPQGPEKVKAVLPIEELDKVLKQFPAQVKQTLQEVKPGMAAPVANIAAEYCTYGD